MIAVWKVGASHAAVQQGATGEDRGWFVSGGDQVGQMGVGVPGGRYHADSHRSDREFVAITHANTVEGHRIVGAHHIRAAVALREIVTTGEVIVVNVGLQHHRAADTKCCQCLLDPVDVALGIDHHR